MVQIVRYLLVAAICLILGRATAFGQTDWDAVLDRYEHISEQCLELRAKVVSGAAVADRSLAGLLQELSQLKSTLQSDGKFIKVIHDRASINFDILSKELKNWLNPRNTLINSFCRAYYKAVPRILAEEYVAQINDQLYDYKLFCFDGKPYCFYVATDHLPGQLSHISFCDLE